MRQSHMHTMENLNTVNMAYLLQVSAPSADENIDGIRQYVQPVNYGAEFNAATLTALGLAAQPALASDGAAQPSSLPDGAEQHSFTQLSDDTSELTVGFYNVGIQLNEIGKKRYNLHFVGVKMNDLFLLNHILYNKYLSTVPYLLCDSRRRMIQF